MLNSIRILEGIKLKTVWVGSLLICSSLVVGCAGKPPLLGTWETQLKVPPGKSVRISFKDDYTYYIDYPDAPGADLWGRYSISEDKVTLVDEGRIEKREVNQTAGTYLYRVEDGTIRFSLIKDKNTARSAGLSRSWIKVEPKKLEKEPTFTAAGG